MKGMIYGSLLCLLGILVFGQSGGKLGTVAMGQTRSDASSLEAQRALVNQYCAGCHNDTLKSGNFSLTEIDLAHPEKNAERVEKVLRKLRAGMMPPAGSPRPETAALRSLAAGLEMRLDEAAARQPFANAPELHRINRTEYRNSVRDILGLDIDVSELLPPDERTNGFDNMADALTVTPTLMSAYVRAAEKVARDAVGDSTATAGMVTYKVSRLTNQMRHIEGTPFGTRGGLSVMHTFPADGEYSFKADFYYYYTEQLIGSALPLQLQNQELEISVDGERVTSLILDPDVVESAANYATEPVKIKAGQRRLSAAFVSKFDGPVQDRYRLVEQTIMDTTISVTPEMTGLPHLQTLSVTGPFKPSGISDSPVRNRVFSCRPSSTTPEEPCAMQIITHIASQAFRRPAKAEDLESLMGYYQEGHNDGGFEGGVRAAIQAVFSKPEFIFRFEKEPAGAQPGQNYPISDLELAVRLAYFLWSTVPDEQLVAAATTGKLKDPIAFEQQVRRMLADPKAESLSTNFAAQWLRLTSIKDAFPEALLFPNFTKTLGNSMRREVELLFDNIVRSDRSILELITADYTFVDEVLAKHYGIPDVVGNRFRRVQLTDPNRFGLLGKGGVLTMTSLANRTSPVVRGKYVLEVLIGSPPPPPPPVVPRLKEAVDNQKVATVRERMEQHRASPACSSCHKIIDPLGLSLENFDAIGVWRTNDSGVKIDATGQMYDGTKLDGPVALRNAVLAHSDAFLLTFTENLLAYGLGRVVDHRDMPTVRAIAREAGKNNNRFSSFISGVVNSTPFRMRTVASPTVQAAAGAADRR